MARAACSARRSAPIRHLRRPSGIRLHGRRSGNAIEATAQAQEAWVAHVNEVAAGTLFPLANSWYMGANIPGKPRLFMPYIGGVGPYRALCDDIAAKGYEGFAVSRTQGVKEAAE